MLPEKRKLVLDVFDYSGNRLCTLYDNLSDVSGQATDVFVNTERNGWRELTFTIPTTCQTEEGEEENYRLSFLKADYRIRLIDDEGTDWFLISEPKVIHSAFSKNVQVTAGHISQLLKVKNLGLEFSDDEGNNVGTAAMLLETILDGTGWKPGNVATFYEKDGVSEKYRTLTASAKTGAFKLISSMCDLFDAKPVYHGATKTVDILPMNPFSEPEDGELPDVTTADGVIELHYGKNVKNVTRTLNTENLVTKMYAYGSYGDKTNGYCGIDECTHTEYLMYLSTPLEAGKTYYFTVADDEGVDITYHFTPKTDAVQGCKLVYSLMDPASMMYVWNESTEECYPAEKGQQGEALNALTEKTEAQNWFSFLMDYRYYREIGLMTDEMLEKVAAYQRTAGAEYQKINEAAAKMADAQTTLSETIGSITFCRLAVKSLGDPNGYETLVLDTESYPKGVVYRTDYDSKEKDYFTWRNAESLDENGDPLNGTGSMVIVIHDTDPVTWNKSYLKAMDDEDNPTVLTLWAGQGTMNLNLESDKIFLLKSNNLNGELGSLESQEEAAKLALTEATKVVTAQHPVYFEKSAPAINTNALNGWGWWWKYYDDRRTSELYFCYSAEGDDLWRYVFYTDEEPTGNINDKLYWFNWRSSVLYRRVNGAWTALTTYDEQKTAAYFGTVYRSGQNLDRLYQGIERYHKYTVTEDNFAAGNWYVSNGYDILWVFSTKDTLNKDDTLTYDTKDGTVKQTKSGTETSLEVKNYRFDSVNYHPENNMSEVVMEAGDVRASDGTDIASDTRCRSSGFISLYPSMTYLVSGFTEAFTLAMYDGKKNWLTNMEMSAGVDGFQTDGNMRYARLIVSGQPADFNVATHRIYALHWDTGIVIEEKEYLPLSPIEKSGDVKGLIEDYGKFGEYADLVYQTYYGTVKAAQDHVKQLESDMTDSLGDILREGYWQDDSYVDGDESKLYDDALDNLTHVAKPEATYEVGYLDLYTANEQDTSYGAEEATYAVPWPDLSIASAVHLIDLDIGVNIWAFLDTVKKCYDKPWKTAITINTNLSTISQHSFTDVMTNIANVASEYKAKASKYNSGVATKVIGTVSGSQIESGTVSGTALAKGAVTAEQLANGAVSSMKLENLAVTTAKIADAAIDAAKIADAAITAAKIANATITAANIQNATIDTAKIALGAITSALIEKGAVGTMQIADGSITSAKIVSLNADVINAGTLSVERLLLKGKDGLIYELNAAAGNLTKEQLSEEKYQEALSGTVLVSKSVTADQIAAHTITANEILANTITAAQIKAETITGNEIAAQTITANKLAADVGSSLDLSSNVSINAKVSEVVKEEVPAVLGYRVEIASSSDVLSSVVKETVLQARVYQGATDVTAKFNSSQFAWKRDSGDEDADAAWAEAYTGVTSIKLGNADVDKQATYTVELDDGT